MYLKRLELYGFKSFAERTVLAFQPGMTGVVGPNGCGKSNVVDAFKWIYGEQSAKGLRGSEMKDVIFNGTQRRKPSGFAEVTIVFDNEDRYLDIDYAEVAVTRRLFRSGESEYLINKQRCRLKDIKGMFIGTGIGQTSYSIFEQGKIDALLNSSSMDRRIILEETAGVSKYRAKREETLRALLRVEDNLTRLNDIIEEVEKRIQRVKNQARKARRFRALSERLKELRLRAAIEDYRVSVRASEDNSFRLAWSDFQCGRLDAVLEELEARLQEEEEARVREQGRVRSLREELETERIQSERVRERIANGTRRSHELAEERETKKADVETTERGLEELREQIHTERSELEVLGTKHAEQELAHTGLEAGREEARRLSEEATRRREEAKAQALELLQQHSRVGNELSQLEADYRNLAARTERLRAGTDGFREQLTTVTATRTTRAAELAQVEVALQDLQAVRHAKEESLAAIEDDLRSLEASRGVQQRALQHCVSRRELLESLEEELEGVSKGVADILRRGDGDSRIPFKQIHGMVASLLKVESRYARAVESVLGSRTQSLVVESQEGALSLLEVARDEDIGAVEVVCLDRVSGTERDYLPKHGGVLGHLVDRVETPAGFEELAERLLAGVILVEDLPTAVALSRNGLRDCRLVTLDGEVVEPWGGLLLPGQSEVGLLSRRSELEELGTRVTVLEEEAALIEESIEAKRAQLKSEREGVEELRGREAERSREVVAVESELGQMGREIERLEREMRVGTSEVEELQTDLDRVGVEQAVARERAVGIEAEQQACELRCRELDDSTREAADAMAQADAALQQARVEKVEVERHLEGLAEMIKRQERLLTERETQLEELRSGITTLEQRERDTIEAVQVSEGELERTVARERTLGDVLQIEEEFDAESDARIRRHRSEIENVRREHGRVSQQREASNARTQEESYRRNHLVERMDEEYGVDLVRLMEREPAVAAAAARLAGAGDEAGEGEAASPQVAESRASEGEAVQADGNETDGKGTDVEPSRAVLASEDQADATAEGVQVEVVPDVAEDPLQAVGIVGDERYLLPDPEWQRESSRDEAKELQEKLRRLGSVNLEALEELDELEERHTFQKAQRDDLLASEVDLRAIMSELNNTCRELFLETFQKVQRHFSDLFRKCFGGGKAELLLEEGVDVLEAGVEIVARPPGKKISSLSLMSGGEKTMTTIALLFALSRTRPSPFCILDEVDAALDEQNVRRFSVLLQDFLEETQFIVITHNKITMAEANTLYGITMQERGVSTRVSVELENFDPDKIEEMKVASPS
jgi:chromosome segregation protein